MPGTLAILRVRLGPPGRFRLAGSVLPWCGHPGFLSLKSVGKKREYLVNMSDPLEAQAERSNHQESALFREGRMSSDHARQTNATLHQFDHMG
jgi:hypothetical protein